MCIFNVSDRWQCIEICIASSSVMEMHIPSVVVLMCAVTYYFVCAVSVCVCGLCVRVECVRVECVCCLCVLSVCVLSVCACCVWEWRASRGLGVLGTFPA